MIIPYSIYSGAGNTFLFFDARKKNEIIPPYFIKTLCQSHSVDGIITVSTSTKADFRMRIFNADGSEAEMCGNGLRCLLAFLEELGETKPCFLIESKASERKGLHTLSRKGENIEISMGTPHIYHWSFSVKEFPFTLSYVNTGVPHVVFFLETLTLLENFSLHHWGPVLRFHSAFAPQGTNVNCACLENSTLHVRTYERGVENETQACGTGVTAVALVAAKLFNLSSPINVVVKSKEILTVTFQENRTRFENVHLSGQVKQLRKGSFDLNEKRAIIQPKENIVD